MAEPATGLQDRAAGALHVPDRVLAAEERPLEVRIDAVVPVALGDFCDLAHHADAGVVDEDVDSPVLCDDTVNELLQRLFAADVAKRLRDAERMHGAVIDELAARHAGLADKGEASGFDADQWRARASLRRLALERAQRDYAAARLASVRERNARSRPPTTSPPSPRVIVTRAQLREIERETIATALEQTGGRIFGAAGAAQLLGMKPTTLASRIKALGLRVR